MFYIYKNKVKFSKNKINKKNILTSDDKVNLALIMFAYLNDEKVDGYKKKDFKKWVNIHYKKIIDFYKKDDSFINEFNISSSLKQNLIKLFTYDESLIKEIILNNKFENDEPLKEFIKINNNFYILINFLKKNMVNNFNYFFKYLVFILFSNKRDLKWR